MYDRQWRHTFLCLLSLLMLPVTGLRAQDPPPLLTRTTLVDGLEVHYRVGGVGPHLLLLHGFTLSGALWEPFLSDLMQRFTVIAPDLPGHGRSASLEGPFRFQRTAEIMFGLLDRLGVERVRGIGHSAGAVVLLHMAGRQPERMEAITLVAGAHRISPKGRQLLRDDRFESLDADSKAFYRNLHPGGHEQITRIFMQLNGLGDNHQDFAFSSEYLSTLPTRTLLVWGDRDDYFPLDIAMELYRALPNAQLWVVPGQGHTPIWESLGGSENAEKMFPAIVIGFFAGEAKILDASDSDKSGPSRE